MQVSEREKKSTVEKVGKRRNFTVMRASLTVCR